MPGGCAFVEDSGCPAPRARLLWDSQHDHSVLTVEAKPASSRHRDTFDLARFFDMATALTTDRGEHVVISDGYRRIRIDAERETLCQGPVHLKYKLQGVDGIEGKILTLRRLVALSRLGRFARHLHPPERLAPRWVAALRVYDAAQDGAGYREIAIALYGEASVELNWRGGSDFLRLRIQRLLRSGRQMVTGGYRSLLR
jgi:hypothetical protein